MRYGGTLLRLLYKHVAVPLLLLQEVNSVKNLKESNDTREYDEKHDIEIMLSWFDGEKSAKIRALKEEKKEAPDVYVDIPEMEAFQFEEKEDETVPSFFSELSMSLIGDTDLIGKTPDLNKITMNLSAASVPVTSVPAVQQEALHLDEVQMNLSAASVTKSVFPVTVILPDISEIIEIALSEKRG